MASKRRLRRLEQRRPIPVAADPYAADIAAELDLIASEGEGRDCCNDHGSDEWDAERDGFLRAFPQYRSEVN